MFPDIPAVYAQTPDFPDVRQFVDKQDNVIKISPALTYHQIIEKYGYPIISKEIAEAIYYARRNAPREREREPTNKQLELMGKRPLESRKSFWDCVQKGVNMGDLPKTKSPYNKEKWLPLARLPFLISHYCCNIMKKLPTKKNLKQKKRLNLNIDNFIFH